jgi:hypothetical protein
LATHGLRVSYDETIDSKSQGSLELAGVKSTTIENLGESLSGDEPSMCFLEIFRSF